MWQQIGQNVWLYTKRDAKSSLQTFLTDSPPLAAISQGYTQELLPLPMPVSVQPEDRPNGRPGGKNCQQ
ncbi:hypothetical protein GCM10007071_31110 [Marinobacter zhanjiangensis]|uniref:Uncharacterized protein n=1 Tax=Marinobacter zhanjiangensis TaxID=578215 RepID=A0ABQ3B6M6_9GAMM|nr:hypothetical protein GCM10007071_31110 [Marinobacter zhanjiangensis]